MTLKTKVFLDEWGLWLFRFAVVLVGLLIASGLFEIASAIDPYKKRHGGDEPAGVVE